MKTNIYCGSDSFDTPSYMGPCHYDPSNSKRLVTEWGSYMGLPRHYDPSDPERLFSEWGSYRGLPCHYDPSDPERVFSEWGSYTGIPRHYDPSDPERPFSEWASPPSPPPNAEYNFRCNLSCTYPGDITKNVPFDPEFNSSDPKLHPQDPKLLDNGFNDQYPAKYAPLTSENFDPESFPYSAKLDPYSPARDPMLLDVSFEDQSPAKVDPEIGVCDYSPSNSGDPSKYLPLRDSKLLNDRFNDQSPDLKAEVNRSALAGENVGGCVEVNCEADKPVNTSDNKCVDNSEGNLTNVVESSGIAANKKESSSASKSFWNTPAEGVVGEEFSREIGYFARNCSLGADSSKSGGSSIGRALCTRMP